MTTPVKIDFNLVHWQVAVLQNKPFPPNDIEGINAHCDLVKEFIQACGYTSEEFITTMWEGTRPKKIFN